MSELITVIDHYGYEHRIRRADYESTRIQLPMFTLSGKRFCDWHEQMGWSGKGLVTTIHRDNIREVIA